VPNKNEMAFYAKKSSSGEDLVPSCIFYRQFPVQVTILFTLASRGLLMYQCARLRARDELLLDLTVRNGTCKMVFSSAFIIHILRGMLDLGE
jgi:hypothetical protein